MGRTNWTRITCIALMVSKAIAGDTLDAGLQMCRDRAHSLLERAELHDLRVERLLDVEGALIDGVPTRHQWYRTTYTIRDPVSLTSHDYEIVDDVWAATDGATKAEPAPLFRHGSSIDELIASAQKKLRGGRPVRQNRFARVTRHQLNATPMSPAHAQPASVCTLTVHGQSGDVS